MATNLKFNKIVLFFILVVALLFIVKGLSFLDPDFGWHFKMGELISLKGIPKNDPFSYTMSSYPFVDHEWLTNYLIFKVFPILSFWGLSIISAFIVFLALLISLFRSKKKFWEVPLLLAAISILPYTGIRPQVESWLFLSLVLLVVFSPKIWSKFKFLLPVFFVIWVNLHGSFAVGLIAILVTFIFKSIRTIKIQKDMLLIFILSLLATFIGPYGGRIWWEVWQQFSDSNLRWSIVEWQPLFFVFNFPLLAYFSISVIFVIKERKYLLFEELGLYFVFFLQAISSQRHLPLWIIVSLPITIKSLYHFSKDVAKKMFALQRLAKIYKITLVGTFVLVIFQGFFVIRGSMGLREEDFYPKDAVTYLENISTKRPLGRIFSEYGWGGYLIWKLPKEKVFIDGRMPSWRYKENPPEESAYVFKDYIELLDGKIDYKEIFEKYKITFVLWPTYREQTFYSKLHNKINKYLPGKLKKPEFNLIDKVKKDGWHEIYKDKLSVIYEKN